jgi:hypothetical protein
MPIRLIRHETILKDGSSLNCGSYEVRFPDGRESVYFYWDDVASRRLRQEDMTSAQALLLASTFARAKRDEMS